VTHIAAGREQRLREDADFRRYWWARQLSTTGNIITLIALPVLVYRLSGSAFLTALTSALEAAPYMLFGLFAGALSDRWDLRLVMINADLANAALAASVPVAYWLGALTVPHVLIVAFGGPAIGVFFDGANFGALPLLVGRERIAQANAVVFGSAAAVETVMPSLVGIGLAVLHPADLLAVDAVSFAASALLLRGITRALHDRARERPRLSRTVLFGDIREGLAFLMRHDGVRTMTIVTAIQSFAGGGFVALMVVWCDRVLGVGTEGWRFRPRVHRLGGGGCRGRFRSSTDVAEGHTGSDRLTGLAVGGAVRCQHGRTRDELAGGGDGAAPVEHLLQPGHHQLDLLPAAGDSGEPAGSGQHRRADACLGSRLDPRGAGGRGARRPHRRTRCPGRDDGARLRRRTRRVDLAAAC